MSSRQPTFQFFPGAYETEGVFVRTDDPCDICRQPSVWRYEGNIYAEGKTPHTCAGCIAEDRLASFLAPRGFSLHDIELDGANDDVADELLQRTPGVACFNPFTWPVIDRIPLAFIGYGDDKRIWSMPEARAAIVAAFAELDSPCDGPSPYALVFRMLDGTQYAAVIDMD